MHTKSPSSLLSSSATTSVLGPHRERDLRQSQAARSPGLALGGAPRAPAPPGRPEPEPPSLPQERAPGHASLTITWDHRELTPGGLEGQEAKSWTLVRAHTGIQKP